MPTEFTKNNLQKPTHMPSNLPFSILQQKKTDVFPISNFTKFAEILHDHLHALLYHIEEIKGRFTLITNLIDRSPELLDQELILYAGSETQRRILEGYTEDKEKRNKELDKNWTFLKNRVMIENTETLHYFPLFREGNLSLKDIKPGLLGDYFKQYHTIGTFLNEFQENEYPILSQYFDTSLNSQDGYVSIPIIAFGTIDGVVHIIFTEKDKETITNSASLKRIIKQFTLSYENQLIGWSVDTKDANQISSIKLAQADIDKEYVHNNPIMKELGLAKYYEITKIYHANRIEDTAKVPNELEKARQKIVEQQRLQAITTILIDSFAHNISAHSLTTLAWWFKERAEYAANPDSPKFKTREQNNPLVQHYQRIEEHSKPLSKELARLFRFLAEKATFWNGVGRRTNFSGQIIALFDVIWYDLIGNPLYLGSIANAEKVRKLHVNITFFEEEVILDSSKPYINRKKIKTVVDNGKTVYLNGTLASINFQDFKNIDYNEDNLAEIESSVFIEKGQLFEVLSEELKQYKVFFPGGVIGKHTFLTIIETEIRNIKHYKDDADIMQRVQEEGLILNISVHKRYVNPDIDNRNNLHEIYKVGISIKLPTEIGAQVIVERLKNLEGDIITPDTYRPRLGGTYQDKICAAMLFNNEFASVQNRTEPRDAHYYPWIKSAIHPVYIDDSQERQEVVDLEMSWRKYESIKDDFVSIYDTFIDEQSKIDKHETGKVYFKKYIHLWRGDNLYYFKSNENLAWENIARHKFVVLLPNQQEDYESLKKIGVVRILQTDTPIGNVSDAYLQWLQIWSKGNKQAVVMFQEGDTNAGRIVYDNNILSFQNIDQVEDEDTDKLRREYYAKMQTEQGMTLRIAHGGKLSYEADICNYRSYGVFMRRFCQGRSLAEVENIDIANLCELYETLITRIAIFDDRAVQRIQEHRRDYYANTLRCGFYQETLEHWEKIKCQGFNKYHFLVVHLAFIEKMKDPEGEEYGENRIIDFINNEILSNTCVEKLQDHFTLVITTGRGRMEWWEKIKATPPLVHIATYRPIESILSAIEDAIMINDDIDLKYNLVKVLIGS
jgi:hypothetical protein